MSRLDGNVYDLFLRVQPTAQEDPSLLLVDIDDAAIANVGEWPWSRDVMADGLILMREMGAASAVFDIEYVNASPHGLDTQALTGMLPDTFSQEFRRFRRTRRTSLMRFARVDCRRGTPGRYVSDLGDLSNQSKRRLLDAVQGVERDNDAFLGQAARFFGNATVTVNCPDQPDNSVPKDLVDYALANLSVKNMTLHRRARRRRRLPWCRRFFPLRRARRARGFPNVIVDPDGVRRRVDLIKAYKGKYFAQLSFSALLSWLGNPAVVLYKNEIVLKSAAHSRPGEDRTSPSPSLPRARF